MYIYGLPVGYGLKDNDDGISKISQEHIMCVY